MTMYNSKDTKEAVDDFNNVTILPTYYNPTATQSPTHNNKHKNRRPITSPNSSTNCSVSSSNSSSSSSSDDSDDTITNHDLKSSVPSNIFFLGGSTCYLITSYMDLTYSETQNQLGYYDTNADDTIAMISSNMTTSTKATSTGLTGMYYTSNADNGTTGDSGGLDEDDYYYMDDYVDSEFDIYNILSSLGALCFVINVLLDLYWNRVAPRSQGRSRSSSTTESPTTTTTATTTTTDEDQLAQEEDLVLGTGISFNTDYKIDNYKNSSQVGGRGLDVGGATIEDEPNEGIMESKIELQRWKRARSSKILSKISDLHLDFDYDNDLHDNNKSPTKNKAIPIDIPILHNNDDVNNEEELEEERQYQNELKWTSASSYAFGIAAMIDLISPLFIHHDPLRLDLCTIISAHIYLLSAICSIKSTTAYYPSASSVMGFMISCGQKQPSDLYTPSMPTRFTLCGEWLFLLGSVIDVVISYISDPEVVKLNGLTLAEWGVVSSVTWLIDAILYLLADAVVYYWRRRTTRLHSSTPNSGCTNSDARNTNVNENQQHFLEDEEHPELSQDLSSSFDSFSRPIITSAITNTTTMMSALKGRFV